VIDIIGNKIYISNRTLEVEMRLFDDFEHAGYFIEYDIKKLREGKQLEPFLGFFEEIQPMLAEDQSTSEMGKINLISFTDGAWFKGKLSQRYVEEEIPAIAFGLFPLTIAEIIDGKDFDAIMDWFINISPEEVRIDQQGKFFKHVVVKGGKYTIFTSVKRGVRSLSLHVGHIHF
jgi:hypothetical protein